MRSGQLHQQPGALALNERTAENLGGKEVVINCLHIKGSWTGLLMNHPPADVHKRFSVPIYKMMYIYFVRGNTAVYVLLLLPMLTSKTQSVEEGAALQLYKYTRRRYYIALFRVLFYYNIINAVQSRSDTMPYVDSTYMI